MHGRRCRAICGACGGPRPGGERCRAASGGQSLARGGEILQTRRPGTMHWQPQGSAKGPLPSSVAAIQGRAPAPAAAAGENLVLLDDEVGSVVDQLSIEPDDRATCSDLVLLRKPLCRSMMAVAISPLRAGMCPGTASRCFRAILHFCQFQADKSRSSNGAISFGVPLRRPCSGCCAAPLCRERSEWRRRPQGGGKPARAAQGLVG